MSIELRDILLKYVKGTIRTKNADLDTKFYSHKELKKMCKISYLIGLHNGTINDLNEYLDKEIEL